MTKQYIPDRGDIIWLDFDPQSGSEHFGHRPALVLSPKSYNKLTSLCLLCPMTRKVKGYPFEIQVSQTSVVLSDQIKSLDWRTRHAKFKEKASDSIVNEAVEKINALIQG